LTARSTRGHSELNPEGRQASVAIGRAAWARACEQAREDLVLESRAARDSPVGDDMVRVSR
jgi:hypothetical protein